MWLLETLSVYLEASLKEPAFRRWFLGWEHTRMSMSAWAIPNGWSPGKCSQDFRGTIPCTPWISIPGHAGSCPWNPQTSLDWLCSPAINLTEAYLNKKVTQTDTTCHGHKCWAFAAWQGIWISVCLAFLLP